MLRIHPRARKPLTLFALLLGLSAIAFHNAVAQQAPDTTRKPVAPIDGHLRGGHHVLPSRPWYDTTKAPKDTAWIASAKGHTYYLEGCRGSLTLTPKNLIHFKTEADAKAAGFTRSKQWGC